MEQQCVWGVKFLKTQIKLKDSSEININDGNLWSIVVSKANQDSEDKYFFFSSIQYIDIIVLIPVFLL